MKKATFFIILFTLLAFKSFANDTSLKTYTLSYGTVEGFIESEDSGVGVELLNEIIKRLNQRGFKIKKEFLPFKRALKMFIDNKIDISFPIINSGSFIKAGYDKWGFKKMPAHSIPLYTAGGFVIYSNNKQQKYDSIKSLEGKKVGVNRGAYIPSYLKVSKKIYIEEVNSGEQNFLKLSKNRIDAFLIHKQWGEGILNKIDNKEFHHGKEFDTIVGSFIFHQNQEGMNLLSEFNYVISTMILDNSYKEILDRYPNNKMVIRYP